MKTWHKVLIGVSSGLLVLAAIAYLGMGYVIYSRLANVKGSCDEHLANRPDTFALHPTCPVNFDVKPYFMSSYYPDRGEPERAAGVRAAAGQLF